MSPSWKPERHSTVAPYLIVEGAQGLIDFLEQTFGATELRRYDMPDGSILHVELLIDDSVIMLGDAGGEWSPNTNSLHVYVEDVDTTYAKGLEAGATSIQEPEHKDGDPDRRGGFRDPWGNTWWVATQVE